MPTAPVVSIVLNCYLSQRRASEVEGFPVGVATVLLAETFWGALDARADYLHVCVVKFAGCSIVTNSTDRPPQRSGRAINILKKKRDGSCATYGDLVVFRPNIGQHQPEWSRANKYQRVFVITHHQWVGLIIWSKCVDNCVPSGFARFQSKSQCLRL